LKELKSIKIEDEIKNWKGRNYFYCNGKIVTGPHGIRPLIVTSIFTFTPIVKLIIFKAKV